MYIPEDLLGKVDQEAGYTYDLVAEHLTESYIINMCYTGYKDVAYKAYLKIMGAKFWEEKSYRLVVQAKILSCNLTEVALPHDTILGKGQFIETLVKARKKQGEPIPRNVMSVREFSVLSPGFDWDKIQI